MNKRKVLIDVSLFLRGEELDPDVVSKALGTVPSSSQSKGKVPATKNHPEYIRDIGVWELATSTNSDTLCDHLDELVSKLITKNHLLRSIKGVEEAYIDMYISTAADEDGGGSINFELNSESIIALARLGLPVRFTTVVVKE